MRFPRWTGAGLVPRIKRCTARLDVLAANGGAWRRGGDAWELEPRRYHRAGGGMHTCPNFLLPLLNVAHKRFLACRYPPRYAFPFWCSRRRGT
jgi:hypothetical protein